MSDQPSYFLEQAELTRLCNSVSADETKSLRGYSRLRYIVSLDLQTSVFWRQFVIHP